MLLHLPVRTFSGVEAPLDTVLTACAVAVAPVPAERVAVGARNAFVLDDVINVPVTGLNDRVGPSTLLNWIHP